VPHADAEWHRLPRDVPVLAEGEAATNFAAGKRSLETPCDRRVEIAANVTANCFRSVVIAIHSRGAMSEATLFLHHSVMSGRS
jgi:hypothetical protein